MEVESVAAATPPEGDSKDAVQKIAGIFRRQPFVAASLDFVLHNLSLIHSESTLGLGAYEARRRAELCASQTLIEEVSSLEERVHERSVLEESTMASGGGATKRTHFPVNPPWLQEQAKLDSGDVGASRRTTGGQADGYGEGTLDDTELAEMEELDQEMRMLAELEEAERARDVALPCELTSSDEEEGRNEDEETLALHALEAAAKARASPSSLSVGSDDLRAMEMAMREDSDTRASAPRTSGVDVRGLTAATERWSAAEPAADGAFRTPSQVCEFVILPGLTGESRDRSRGLHVLITKP